MKRIMNLLLALCLSLGIINVTNIYAEDTIKEENGILTNFSIDDFNNGEIYTETTYGINYELSKEVERPLTKLCYVNERGENVVFSESNGTIKVDEINKLKSKTFTFLYLELSYQEYNEGSYLPQIITEMYSPYTLERLNELGAGFGDDVVIYFYDSDYSFQLLDAEVDTKAPSLESLTLTQNGRYITYEYTTDENHSGMDQIQLNFKTKLDTGEYDFLELQSTADENQAQSGKIQGMIDLKNFYRSHWYGTYTLSEIILLDKAGNETRIPSNEENFDEEGNSIEISDPIDVTEYMIDLTSEDNPYNNIESAIQTVRTQYIDNKIYFRKDTGHGYGNVTYDLKDDVTGELLYTGTTFVFPFSVDLSKEGSSTVTYPMTFTINPSEETVTININIEVCVVDVIGTILENDYDVEICYGSFEEFMNRDTVDMRTEYPASILLDTGEMITELMVSGGSSGGFLGGGYDGRPYCVEGMSFFYNPRYMLTSKEENIFCSLNYTRRIYIQDEYGNLIDKDGNITVLYEDRQSIVHESDNESVSVTSLEGSVPTYSIVNASEVELEDTFENENVAYDISLYANNGTVQPVDAVEVSIALPENLQGEEVEVYYVDDEGNTTLLDSSIEGDCVVFETDHFSVYAVVKKDGIKVSEIESKYEDLSSADQVEEKTNTPSKIEESSNLETPSTGDQTSLQLYFALVLIAFCTILVFKRTKQLNK